MDDIVVRPRYPRQSTTNRRRRKNVREANSTLGEVIARQIVISIIVLAVIGIIKSANTPVTNFLTGKVKDVLTQNIEVKTINEGINNVVNKLNNRNKAASDGDSTSEEPAVTASAGVTEESNNDESEKLDYSGYQEEDELVQSEEDSISGNTDEITDEPVGENEKEAIDNAASESEDTPESVQTKDNSNVKQGKYNFVVPAPGPLGSPYGYRTDPFSGTRKLHKGIDIEANTGTPIKAALAGEVIQSGEDPTFGKYIKIKHVDGLETIYAHCSELVAKKGQSVKKSEIIAKVGSTGNSIGAHLHFEVHKDGKTVDPLQFISVKSK
ncbi:MAG: peptidoglycan DD-metalloendopeptidase family protein [Clostridia bacterium]|nr:peptidoglycan DD-metalloendopeptidase family protein [Clostridia bacterium]